MGKRIRMFVAEESSIGIFRWLRPAETSHGQTERTWVMPYSKRVSSDCAADMLINTNQYGTPIHEECTRSPRNNLPSRTSSIVSPTGELLMAILSVASTEGQLQVSTLPRSTSFSEFKTQQPSEKISLEKAWEGKFWNGFKVVHARSCPVAVINFRSTLCRYVVYTVHECLLDHDRLLYFSFNFCTHEAWLSEQSQSKEGRQATSEHVRSCRWCNTSVSTMSPASH